MTRLRDKVQTAARRTLWVMLLGTAGVGLELLLIWSIASLAVFLFGPASLAAVPFTVFFFFLVNVFLVNLLP
jgi:hypothetical protein